MVKSKLCNSWGDCARRAIQNQIACPKGLSHSGIGAFLGHFDDFQNTLTVAVQDPLLFFLGLLKIDVAKADVNFEVVR
jgi:hypothetical protein